MVISPQVLAEFSATLLHKVSPSVRPEDLTAILNALSPIKVVATDADIARRAVEAHAKYQVHFYDGMIIASAERGRCTRLWSEDFNSGQEYFGVVAKNPFE
jgi:predicted nucleic acid-binding protein